MGCVLASLHPTLLSSASWLPWCELLFLAILPPIGWRDTSETAGGSVSLLPSTVLVGIRVTQQGPTPCLERMEAHTQTAEKQRSPHPKSPSCRPKAGRLLWSLHGHQAMCSAFTAAVPAGLCSESCDDAELNAIKSRTGQGLGRQEKTPSPSS